MVMRIGGLASGMDTDQIIKDLLKAERVKGDKLFKTKEQNKWRIDVYNQVNKSFANFILDTKKEFGLMSTSSNGMLLKNSLSSLDWVKKASISDDTKADITASADTVKGNYSVHIEKLAANWSAASGIKADGEETILKKLSNLLNDGTNNNIHFEITGYKKDTDGNVKKVTIDQKDDNITSVSDIVDRINNADIGVKVIYDENLDRFFLQTMDTGESDSIIIDDTSKINGVENSGGFITGDNNILRLQYIDSIGESKYVANHSSYGGTDAEIDFGAAKGIKQSNNDFSINGINFTLKDTGNFNIDVSTNIDGMYDKICNFVTKYNEILDNVAGKLTEKNYRDFLPLTDEEKETMSDKEVELWEEKGKKGLLRNDNIISSTLNGVRSSLYQSVYDSYDEDENKRELLKDGFNQLTQIGITTQKYSSGTVGGKLMIDEKKLKEAIAKDPDAVMNLLFKQTEDSELLYESESQLTKEQIAKKRNESGLIIRIYDNLIGGMKEVITKSGTGDNSNLYRNISSNILIDFVTKHSSISVIDEINNKLTQQINNFNDYLIDKENSYYRKFTAMEKAINYMNQQSSWLAQQFGG